MESDELCRFCGSRAALRESHVLPAFVFRWLKNRSGPGHIRHTDNPNRRVQDGVKLRWLCGSCEELFSRFETAFATKIFHPWHKGSFHLGYDEWLLKFCVSISWRVLKFARGQNKNHQYKPEQVALLDLAEARWRSFLNDEAPHPGGFEQHLLIFDIAKSTTIPNLPSNFNRFMTGMVTYDILGSDRSLMTFAKLGRFLIFGHVQNGGRKWVGTKVHVRHGELRPGQFEIPAGLLHVFVEKANAAAAALESISPAQQAKIDQHILQNIDEFRESDQFRSIMADAEMFGIDAVIKNVR